MLTSCRAFDLPAGLNGQLRPLPVRLLCVEVVQPVLMAVTNQSDIFLR